MAARRALRRCPLTRFRVTDARECFAVTLRHENAREAHMGKLDGCVALVTGAARGIGRAIALRYAREGATVAVVDLQEAFARSTVEEIRALRGTAEAFAADLGEPAQSAAMVGRVAERFGRLDILV